MTGTLRANPDGLVAVAGALEALAGQLDGLVGERAGRLAPPGAGGDEVSRTVGASIGEAAREVMADDARFLHAALVAAGAKSELQQWPDQGHVFQLFPMLSPESRHAVSEAARFVNSVA